uniref:NADH-ubiquinone oxidoreductase chain 1 n=2 Tax=Neelus murinus TaxID=1348065 RepID=A0A6B9IQI8_9HEXA|nr:NADH dehydrogenase subunit 1 [Neelus murinus]
MYMGILNILSLLLLVIGVMLAVAFIILLERKILSYVQIRSGPSKVSFGGLLQSLGDAVKLFIKQQTMPLTLNFFVYYLTPVLALSLCLITWVVINWGSELIYLGYGVLLFFCCTSFGGYVLLGAGWSSNSLYSLIGALRGIAQTISYEVSLALILISLIFLTLSYDLFFLSSSGLFWWLGLLFYPLALCFFGTLLAETNRSPFDFSEGESELVSGFNVEYGSGGFAVLFLAEYGMIIFMSFFFSFFILGAGGVGLFCLSGGLISALFILIRSSVPSYRYDMLMDLAWKSLLPVSLLFLMYYFWVLMV